tara:strand:- start:43014 stop:44579 length:1566 start_codon:yes stop_codon:yes gene_type:complete
MRDHGVAVTEYKANSFSWFWPLVALGYCALVLLLFKDTSMSIWSIWQRSDTYAHGFLIVPISLWIAWNARAQLATMTPRSNPLILLLLPVAGFGWLLAAMVNVLVVQQLCLVAILILGLWAILGNAVTRVLAFPLAFLFLAVPMGQALIPPLMEFTATSTVWLVQMSGIPVYREGMYFMLPSGSWSVVAACSGSRYLIASFTLGLLYAHLTYRSRFRIAAFVLASILFPILANSLRAYMIVMIGHWSGMELATGVDHLVYGWVFFGIVMVLLFWLGSLWREDDLEAEPSTESTASVSQSLPQGLGRTGFTLVATLLLAGAWPFVHGAFAAMAPQSSSAVLQAPAAQAPWTAIDQSPVIWAPQSPGADREFVAWFESDSGQAVGLFVQQYLEQEQGVELVGSNLRVNPRNLPWRIVRSNQSLATLDDVPTLVDQWLLRDANQDMLVWAWYRIGGNYTANPYVAKLFEAWNTLSFSRRDASRIIVAAPFSDTSKPEAVLQRFLDQHLVEIEATLDNVAGSDAD